MPDPEPDDPEADLTEEERDAAAMIAAAAGDVRASPGLRAWLEQESARQADARKASLEGEGGLRARLRFLRRRR